MNPLLLLACFAQVSWVVGDCGNTPFNPLHTGFIVGGHEAIPHSIPWQISLRAYWHGYEMGHSCGGSIVSDQYVITAAHCIVENYYWKPFVVVGAHNIKLEDEYEKKVMVSEVIVHPKWDSSDYTMYDIALLKLEERITFNDGVQPICIPEATQEYSDDAEFMVSGWGARTEEGIAPHYLLQVTLPRITNDVCRQASGYYWSIHDKVICAGLPEGGKGSCTSDSGGPLAIQVEGKWTLAGVVSWGVGCARPGQPGVYTHVAKYRDFIDQYVN